MRHLHLFFLLMAALAFAGCDTAISVIISNPAGGTLESPKQLAPGEQLGVIIHQDADLATFKVTIHDPNTGDDACPYYLPADISEMFAPLSAGATVKAMAPGRLSVCGPFLMKAEAQFATPPSANKVFTTSETWFIGYEIRKVPAEDIIKLKVGEAIDVGVDFLKPAVGDFDVRAAVSEADIPIATVNNSLPDATVKVAKGDQSVRFQIKAVNKGQCFLWIDLLGGPDYAKTIVVE
ncbi:MAG: hypothetical protein WA004_13385 [Saprospiraceae bacterium]